MFLSISAWLDNSSLAAAHSSEVVELAWTTCNTCIIPWLTCEIPEACSLEAIAISPTRVVAFEIASTILFKASAVLYHVLPS